MKKISLIGVLFVASTVMIITACGGNDEIKRTPGKIYMPDMTYSRAYETYTTNPVFENGYTNQETVKGTVKRGDMLPYHLQNTEEGYAASAGVKNPLPALDEKNMMEAERLYNVYCGVCHGNKLDGNGPLYNGGDGPFPAKPATLVGDAVYEAMAEGTMFHSITYGKNLMGSHASQLTKKQRWMIVHYIKAKQAEAK